MYQRDHRRPWERAARTVITALAVSAMLLVSACSASDPDDGPNAGGGTLTVGMKQPGTNLDPATSNPPDYVFPAYEPLIYQQPDGSFTAALATSWEYLDDTNTSFQVTLREGLLFSDGDVLDADAVVGSLERFLSLEDNSNLRYAGPIDSITAVDDVTIEIGYSSPFPNAALSLTQDWRFGLIVSPTGLAEPDLLNTETHGAGQYVVDSAASVAGSEYTYVRNENYWNQDAIKFDEVVLKTISDTAAQLSALESGQIDFAVNAPISSLQTAEESGYQTTYSGVFMTLMLVGRDGDGPLSDVRVREAISLALDREAIGGAVFRGEGAVISSVAQEGQVGYYDPEPAEQDIERAKELLAEAGYPEGVTITLLDIDGVDPNYAFATAVQGQLAEAGITVELQQVTGNFDQFLGPLYGGEVDAAVWQFSNVDTYFNLETNFASPGTLGNPGGTVDDEFDSLLNKAAAATGEDYDVAMQTAVQRYDELYWTVPVVLSPNGFLFSTEIENVPSDSLLTQSFNFFSPDPGSSLGFVD